MERDPHLEHMAWAIEQRAEIQRTLLALYEFVHLHPVADLQMEERYLLDHLIGAAFSLWRAAFLAETLRQQEKIHESQEKFLEKVITDNAITFNDDKLNRHWTVEYYLENAKLRLARAIGFSDHYKHTELHDTLIRHLRLRGTDGIDLTQWEWESAHYVLRAIFKIIAPEAQIELTIPPLPR
jgi:hypothetical protein